MVPNTCWQAGGDERWSGGDRERDVSVWKHPRVKGQDPQLSCLWHPLDRALPVPLGPPAPQTFQAVPRGRAVTLGLALLCGGWPQGLGALARGLPSVAGTAHGALLLPEAALRRALWGVADERKPGTAAHPAAPALGPRSAGCTRLPRPTRPPPSGPEGSGAGCSAWWLVAWPRAGNARGAAWRGDLRSYRGPRGGGGPARSWGCTAVGRGCFMLSGRPAPHLNKDADSVGTEDGIANFGPHGGATRASGSGEAPGGAALDAGPPRPLRVLPRE